jgi:phage host-nuclease inhibitor protein Gam
MADHLPIPLPASLAAIIEPFTDDELDAAIVAQVEGREVPAKVGNFAIDTDPKAEWALRKLAALDARRMEIIETHQAWIAQIEQSLAENVARIDPRVEVFRNALEQYAKNKRAEDDRAKTIQLPSGTVSTTRTQKPSVHIANEEAVLKWAMNALNQNDYERVVKLSPKVLVSKLREIVDITVNERGHAVVWRETGEYVPGVYVEEPGRITATVKVNE